MVWIYGGAFVTGSAATTHNRPDFLIEKDVVFVSLNYRLGALGKTNFFYLYFISPNQQHYVDSSRFFITMSFHIFFSFQLIP